MRAGFSRAFAHVLTAAMASFQMIAPPSGRRPMLVEAHALLGSKLWGIRFQRNLVTARLRGCRGAGPRRTFSLGTSASAARAARCTGSSRRGATPCFGCVGAVPGFSGIGAAGAGTSHRTLGAGDGPDHKRGDGRRGRRNSWKRPPRPARGLLRGAARARRDGKRRPRRVTVDDPRRRLA